MKFIDEYHNPLEINKLTTLIRQKAKKSWKIMEVCGGQTHTIVKYGLDQLLPPSITLLHGPGCPICVTPLESIDRAIALSLLPKVLFCSFGDMIRVPGGQSDLLRAKAQGAKVQMVSSPLDAVALAEKNPQLEVVFFAVGFETTAPANALAVLQAYQKNLSNFSLLVSHVLVPPAMESILNSPNHQVDAFLAAGHVCTITGEDQYLRLSKEYRIPIIITGFYPLDILEGILLALTQLESVEYGVINQYIRSVRSQGNFVAQQTVQEVFEVCPQKWRGIGSIEDSGLQLKKKFRAFDANFKFSLKKIRTQECSECLSGEILTGQKKPYQCPLFGNKCTPENPRGATMVSSEGACSIYHQFRAHNSFKNIAEGKQ